MTKQLLVIVSIFLFTCSMRTNNKESFEGVISYKITYTAKGPNQKFNDYQRKKYGDVMNMYIDKNGNYRKEYPNSFELGFEYNLYNVETNKTYLKWRNIDSLITYDCSKNTVHFLADSDMVTEPINGSNCRLYGMVLVDSGSKRPMVLRLQYFYPVDKEYIDPKLYENFKDFYYDKVMSHIQSPYYKYVMDMGVYEIKFELVKVEKKPVSQELFKIPKK